MRMEMSNLRAAQKDLGDGRRWFGKGRERKKKAKEKCLQNRYNKNSTERERLAMISVQNSVGGIKAVLREALLLFRWLWKSCTQ